MRIQAFRPGLPEMNRRLIEVSSDGADEPAISAPVVDFFGVLWDRRVPLESALIAVAEGQGLNSFTPTSSGDRRSPAGTALQ